MLVFPRHGAKFSGQSLFSLLTLVFIWFLVIFSSALCSVCSSRRCFMGNGKGCNFFFFLDDVVFEAR